MHALGKKNLAKFDSILNSFCQKEKISTEIDDVKDAELIIINGGGRRGIISGPDSGIVHREIARRRRGLQVLPPARDGVLDEELLLLLLLLLSGPGRCLFGEGLAAQLAVGAHLEPAPEQRHGAVLLLLLLELLGHLGGAHLDLFILSGLWVEQPPGLAASRWGGHGRRSGR